MPSIKELLNSAAKIDARMAGQQAAAVVAAKAALQSTTVVPVANPAGSDDEAGGDSADEALGSFDVYKVIDGVRAERASKYNVTREEADEFVADNPDDEYEIVEDPAE